VGDFTTLSPALSNWIAQRCPARHGSAGCSEDDDAMLELLGAIGFPFDQHQPHHAVIVCCKVHPDDKVVDGVRRLSEEGAAAGQ
jgi:hypothetical protein